MTDLKPCPFCGSANIDHYFDTATEYLSEKHFGHCRNCGVDGPSVWRARNGESWDEIHARVVDAWNRRAEVPKRIDGKPTGMSAEQFDACYEEDGDADAD